MLPLFATLNVPGVGLISHTTYNHPLHKPPGNISKPLNPLRRIGFQPPGGLTQGMLRPILLQGPKWRTIDQFTEPADHTLIDPTGDTGGSVLQFDGSAHTGAEGFEEVFRDDRPGMKVTIFSNRQY